MTKNQHAGYVKVTSNLSIKKGNKPYFKVGKISECVNNLHIHAKELNINSHQGNANWNQNTLPTYLLKFKNEKIDNSKCWRECRTTETFILYWLENDTIILGKGLLVSFFTTRYRWFTVLYKFQVYNIVIHNFFQFLFI